MKVHDTEATFPRGGDMTNNAVLHWKNGLFGGKSGGIEKSPENPLCRISGDNIRY